MKKHMTILCALAVAAFSSFYFAGCTTEETVATGNLATGLMATSLSSTSIGLRWTRGSDAGTNTVLVKNSTGIIIDSMSVAGPSGASAVISGLATGNVYTFAVR